MTDKLRAAAKKAIEALETFHRISSVEHLHIFETITIPEAVQALRQALNQLPDDTKMIDTGIDRGAWDDVPDATKWVDELRGDEPEFECPRCGHCCQFVEPPNSTTDVVEPEEPLCYLQETDTLGGGYEQVIWGEGFPVYTAPPKREWVGLTDEEIEEGYEQCWVESKQAWESAVWWAEAKLKEKNDANHV